MEDRCDGTQTSVKKGSVIATDLGGSTRTKLLAGELEVTWCDVPAYKLARVCVIYLYEYMTGFDQPELTYAFLWRGPQPVNTYELCLVDSAGAQRCAASAYDTGAGAIVPLTLDSHGYSPYICNGTPGPGERDPRPRGVYKVRWIYNGAIVHDLVLHFRGPAGKPQCFQSIGGGIGDIHFFR
jgi:hypothetical protein